MTKIQEFICKNYPGSMKQIVKGVEESIPMKCEVHGVLEESDIIIHHSFDKSDVKLKLSRYFDSEHYMVLKPSDML